MNPLPNIQPPNAVDPNLPDGYGIMQSKVRALARWTVDITGWLTRDTMLPMRRAINQFLSNGAITLFAQTQNVTVGNTAVETTLLGTGTTGGLILPAGFLTPGRNFGLIACGFYTTTGTPTMRQRLYLDSTLIFDTTANQVGTNISPARMWWAQAQFTCQSTGTSGTVIGQGGITYALTHTTSTFDDFGPLGAPINVDTTLSHTMNLTFQWGTGAMANSITATNVTMSGF